MIVVREFLSFFQALARNERGSIATFLAVAVIPLVAFGGLAVDSARGYLAKQRLSYAIESAALAAAKAGVNATDAEIEEIGNRYFNANFPAGSMGSMNLDVTYAISTNKREITVNASTDIQTAMMTVLGIDTMTVGSQVTALRESKGLELVLALDNTGSMGGYVDDLEDAAQQLLDVLYGETDTVENLWVSVVPFDTRVNLANYAGNVAFAPSDANRVCANPRPSPYTTDEAAPSTSAFNSEYTQWSRGCKGAPALALTAEKSTVEAALADMDAEGYTRIDVGASWAHRMLSPAWRGLWGNAELPLDYNTPLMDKAAIIMTDGENNPKDGTSKATANARLLESCTAMKADNIIVYTIQYRDDDEDLKTLMKNCATSNQHYFYAEDDDLTSVFDQIANQLSNLRILNVM